MSTARAKVDQAGRVLIPAKLRRDPNVGPGDAVMLVTRGEELHVGPYRQAIREAQAIIRKYIPGRERSFVDELNAERRREAERE